MRPLLTRLLLLRAFTEPRVVAGTVGAMFALLSLRAVIEPVFDPDVWWVAAVGRDEILRGHLPRTNGYSFVDGAVPWVMHEWLLGAPYALGLARFCPPPRGGHRSAHPAPGARQHRGPRAAPPLGRVAHPAHPLRLPRGAGVSAPWLRRPGLRRRRRVVVLPRGVHAPARRPHARPGAGVEQHTRELSVGRWAHGVGGDRRATGRSGGSGRLRLRRG